MRLASVEHDIQRHVLGPTLEILFAFNVGELLDPDSSRASRQWLPRLKKRYPA